MSMEKYFRSGIITNMQLAISSCVLQRTAEQNSYLKGSMVVKCQCNLNEMNIYVYNYEYNYEEGAWK